MRFGLFYEHQLPRPWEDGLEQRLFQDALDQVELADRLGFDTVWEVEHHFLEEYSHSSAPEVFLAACSQRTRRIRLGHGIVLMPPGYNHPARVAERIATLDLVSNGRVEWGTGESSANLELGGYGVAVEDKRDAWRESVEQCANMLAMDPYPGFEGRFFSMPCRNIVPKPVQRPHPPLWVACSNRETIKLAARLGIGALTFAFVDPAEARQWVDDYYRIFREECVPIGHAVNPNICMVSSFGLHHDLETARARFQEGFRFFQFALGWHYLDCKEAHALSVLSGVGGIVKLSHWFLTSICINLEANLVVLEFAVEWTTAVIEKLAHLYFNLLASSTLKNLWFHLAHSLAHPISSQVPHE